MNSASKQTQSSKIHVFARTSIFLSIVLLIFLVGGLVSLYASTGEQTYASAFLDATGQHKLALAADVLRKNPGVITNFSTLNPNSNCDSAWTVNMNPRPVYAAGASLAVEVLPLNDSYKNNLYIQNSYDVGFNAKKTTANIKLKQFGSLNFNMIEENSDYVFKKNPGILYIDTDVEGILTKSDAYIKVNKVALKNSEFSTEDSLSQWYNQSYEFTNTQQEGVVELGQVGESVLSWNPADMVSQSVGKKYLQMQCNSLKDISVSGIKTVKVGQGEAATEIRAREVIMIPNTDAEKNMANQYPDLVEEIVKDGVLKSFLKNQYNLVEKAGRATNKMNKNNLDDGNVTSQEYATYIDEIFADFNKDDFKKSLQTSEDAISKDVTFVAQNPIYYLDAKTTDISAAKSVVVIQFSDSFLNNIKGSELKNTLKDGIRVTVWLSNIQTNNALPSVQVPTLFKPISSLEEDFINTNTYKKAEEIVNQNVEQ